MLPPESLIQVAQPPSVAAQQPLPDADAVAATQDAIANASLSFFIFFKRKNIQ